MINSTENTHLYITQLILKKNVKSRCVIGIRFDQLTNTYRLQDLSMDRPILDMFGQDPLGFLSFPEIGI